VPKLATNQVGKSAVQGRSGGKRRTGSLREPHTADVDELADARLAQFAAVAGILHAPERQAGIAVHLFVDGHGAALQVPISVTAATDPSEVVEYVRKYGFTEEERHKRRNEILNGLVQTEARNGFAEYGAYEIYANQEAIQKRIIDALRPQLAGQLMLTLESVQIGNPDFLDDRIEQAASAVVANEKQKQAEEARYKAAEVAAKTKQIEALTYANPALLAIKKLELELELERARAEGIKGHQGPLTIVYEGRTGVQLQVPTRQ